jgi:hypothetical protein
MSVLFVLKCDKCGGYSRVAEACPGGDGDGHKEIEPYFCAHCGTQAGEQHTGGFWSSSRLQGPLKKQIEEARK